MSESRYLLSFAMLLTGALVICGPMVLVWATAEQDTSWLDAEPPVAPYAIAGKGWEATVTVEADALPQAVPLAPADGYVAYLHEVRPVLDVLAAADGANEQVQVAELEEEIIAESSGASVTYTAETAPSADPPSADTVVAELDETHATPDTQHEAQPVQVAELDETQQAPAQTPEEINVPEEPAGIDDSTSSIKTAPDIAPPLPSRRPAAPIKTAEIIVPQETQETSSRSPASSDERRNDDTAPQRWRPMALAPADADTPAPPKLSSPAPKDTRPTMSTAAHRSKVWSALARAKPHAGQRGSATVAFNIGANGALRGARIAKSSGNAKIDQMALATVRKAGPFPPPPGLKSGAASYTIRMDFR
ncbi:MAG: TonB family protein [Alphaproteobacteria bacterium]|nr:TonB family protein [Alphaproteobacteria bacterium]